MKDFLDKTMRFLILVLLILITTFLLPFAIDLALATEHGVTTSEDPLDYTPLTPLYPEQGSETNLTEYLNNMFRILLGIAAILAVVVIVVAGIRYAASDSEGKKSEARKKIVNALWGLILAMGSWLIINTVNPEALDFDLKLKNISTNLTSPGIPASTWGDDSTPRNYLNLSGVQVKEPSCKHIFQDNCTSVFGFDFQTLDKIIDIKKECDLSLKRNCNVLVTGGTEYWHHVSHGPNKPFVDFRKNGTLDDYVVNMSGCSEQTPIGKLYKIGANSFVDEGTHWHACLGTRCQIKNWTPKCK